MREILRVLGDTLPGTGEVKSALEGLPKVDANAMPSNVVNTLLYVVGIIAVAMIIVAGVQMTTSAGDPGAVAKAKKTMTGAIIGLAIAVLAYAIVNFVVGRL